MANPLKGEVGFEVEGQAYVLVLDFNALCTLEDALDLGIVEIVTQLQTEVRGGFLRALFWAGLQEHHSGLNEKAAGRLIGALGYDRALALVLEGFAAAFPPKEDANAPADPRPKAKRNRGTSPPATGPGPES